MWRPTFLCNSCSQIRITTHPFLVNSLVTIRSRRTFAINFLFQNGLLFVGILKCFGQLCQKQPSTKIAIFSFLNTKSGLPRIGECLRQPLIPVARSNFAKATSVFLFPRPRMSDITSDRFDFVNTSGIFTQENMPLREFPKRIRVGGHPVSQLPLHDQCLG
jgi:hypothetical protein